MLQAFYLRTSRQIRQLDLEAKSPLYTHFTETIAGAPTIRAFGMVSKTIQINHDLLDDSQRPFYLLFCLQRWLNLVLGLIVAGFATVMVSVALLIPRASTSSSTALGLLTLVNFSQDLALLISVWTMLETSLGALARLKTFVNETPVEDRDSENGKVPTLWPSHGSIKFEHVTASYE